MPIQIDPAIIDQLVERQMMQERFAPKAEGRPSDQSQLDPSLMAMLGAAADGISTHSVLSRGAKEDNAMFAGSSNPAVAGLMAAGTGMAVPLLGKLLKNKLPQGLIDAIVANMGARTTASAGMNAEDRGGGLTHMQSVLDRGRK